MTPNSAVAAGPRSSAPDAMLPTEGEIHAEEVALLYRNAGVSQVAVLLVAHVLAAAVWHTANRAVVLGWLAAMVAITLARLQLGKAFRQASPAATDTSLWRNRFVVAAACSGVTWGAAALCLMPATGLEVQFVVIFTLAGMVAAAVPTQAPVPIAFHVFCALTLAPLALRLLAGQNRAEIALGMLTIVYMLGMAGITRRIHASLRTTLELRQQNRSLVEVLTRANADAEAVNAKLVLEVAEHRRTGASLERSLSLLRATLESTNDGIAVVDRTGRLVSHNQRFLDLWRLPAAAVACGTVDGLLRHMRPQLTDPDGFAARCAELIASAETETSELVELADGRVFERFSMPQRIGGAAVGRVCSYRDITARRHAERDLEFVANHDPLTQLPNRSLFARRLAEALARARRRDARLAVLFIDLDRFKNINDTLGHDAGDRMLCEVAARLRRCLREVDTVARLGGDEFVVLLDELQGLHAMAQVAQRILDALGQPYCIDGRECHATASIGISTYPEDGDDTATLLKHADIAMYRAKEKGKNAFELYADRLNVHTIERLALEASLRRAIERDELVLHFQPKFEIASRRIVGVEALVRWRHPELGFVQPGAFIPLAEETGLIVPIGEWVLRHACAQARRWMLDGLAPLRVAVNISARQFSREDLIGRIDAVLAESGLDPDQLEVEITESMTMQDVDRALEVMAALKSRGIHLAIDDFGTGYSSLGYLKRFPIDSIKIDRSFVRDVPQGPGDCALVQAVIGMAHALGMRAVAEGVETAGQHAFLQHHGCDEVQGFLFARPMPADELARFVRGHADVVAGGLRRSA